MKKNTKIIVIIIMVAMVIAGSIVLDINCEYDRNKLSNTISTIGSIQVTIAGFILAMFSITTAFFNEDIYGVKLKDVFKLRKGINLSLLDVTMNLITYIFITIISIIYNWLFTSFLMVILTIVICVYTASQDLPLCFKKDEAIIKVIKNNRNNIEINGLNNTEIYNTIVINFVTDKKIEKTYEMLKKSENDTFLIDYLFNLIINKLTNFKKFENEIQVKYDIDRFVDATLENIDILFGEKSKILEDYNDLYKISIYLSKIFYYINYHKDLLDKTTTDKFIRKFSLAFALLTRKEDDKKSKVVFNMYQLLVASSFRHVDFSILKLFKKVYSNWNLMFTNYKLMNILFSEISFISFCYNCQYENFLPMDKKQELLNFIDNQDERGTNRVGFSWKELFHYHLTNYSLSFKELYENIDINLFEYGVSYERKTLMISKESLADWWIKCLVNSDEFYSYNLENLYSLNAEQKNILTSYLNLIFDINNKTMNFDKTFKQFITFFTLSDKYNDINFIYKDKIEALSEFKTEFNKQKEEEKIIKNNVSQNIELLNKLLEDETEKYFKSLWENIDVTLDLSDKKLKGFCDIFEIYDIESSKKIYFDIIKSFFQKDFYEIFEEQLSNDYIPLNGIIDNEKLKKCLEIEPKFTTEKIMYILKSKENIDSELVENLEKLDSEIEVCKNPLLKQYCYANEKAIKYNYEIKTFGLEPIDEKDCLIEMDKYKAPDGTYFYNNVQYSYDELVYILKQKLFKMKIYLKYKIVYDKNNLCVFDPWGYHEKRKKKNENK